MPAGAFAALQILAIFLVLLAACAKVADPLPPVVQAPDTTQELRAEASGDSVRVYFPVRNPNIEWVEVFRHCNLHAPVSRFSMIARISSDELRASEQAGVFVFVDPSADDRQQCRYTVRFVDTKGQNSDFSNVAGTSADTSN